MSSIEKGSSNNQLELEAVSGWLSSVQKQILAKQKELLDLKKEEAKVKDLLSRIANKKTVCEVIHLDDSDSEQEEEKVVVSAAFTKRGVVDLTEEGCDHDLGHDDINNKKRAIVSKETVLQHQSDDRPRDESKDDRTMTPAASQESPVRSYDSSNDELDDHRILPAVLSQETVVNKHDDVGRTMPAATSQQTPTNHHNSNDYHEDNRKMPASDSQEGVANKNHAYDHDHGHNDLPRILPSAATQETALNHYSSDDEHVDHGKMPASVVNKDSYNLGHGNVDHRNMSSALSRDTVVEFYGSDDENRKRPATESQENVVNQESYDHGQNAIDHKMPPAVSRETIVDHNNHGHDQGHVDDTVIDRQRYINSPKSDEDSSDDTDDDWTGDHESDDNSAARVAQSRVRKRSAWAVRSPVRKRVKTTPFPSSNSVTPSPSVPKVARRRRAESDDYDDASIPEWVEEMREWMITKPHGKMNKAISETNANQVIRQVKKLVAGKGIRYDNWGPCVIFCPQKVDLSTTNFSALWRSAKDFEREHGKDRGNGWLLRHPIKKLELFQDMKQFKPY